MYFYLNRRNRVFVAFFFISLGFIIFFGRNYLSLDNRGSINTEKEVVITEFKNSEQVVIQDLHSYQKRVFNDLQLLKEVFEKKSIDIKRKVGGEYSTFRIFLKRENGSEIEIVFSFDEDEELLFIDLYPINRRIPLRWTVADAENKLLHRIENMLKD